MNYHRLKQKVIVPLFLMPALFSAGSASAADGAVDTSLIDDASAAVAVMLEEAQASQVRINELSDLADERFKEYQEVAKIVDGLEVYNAGMRRTIAEQEKTIKEYDEAITQAAELQRQIPPLMERMMVALEQFVELDLPFHLDNRRQRLQIIRDAFDDPNVNIAEKFRLVLVAYTSENDYGRSISTYTDTLEIDGVDRDVDILQVGRIALIYQTSDQNNTGVWDKNTKQWVHLGDEYRRPVANAIRIAQGTSAYEILELPITAPEFAR